VGFRPLFVFENEEAVTDERKIDLGKAFAEEILNRL
jgi:hypothetical protein